MGKNLPEIKIKKGEGIVKKSVWNKAAALAIALGICLSAATVSYADVTMVVDYSDEVVKTAESETFLETLTGITHQALIRRVSNVNTTFQVDKAASPDIELLSEIVYGYVEGGRFFVTSVREDIYNLGEANLDLVYPVFDEEFVQADLQAGTADRVYAVIIDGVSYSGDDLLFPYLFRISSTNAAAEAGKWVQDAQGWWYLDADGSYPVNTWKEINGKQYYFGADGYMLHDTVTPDGYNVGADGAWIN